MQNFRMFLVAVFTAICGLAGLPAVGEEKGYCPQASMPLKFMTFNIWGDYFGNPVEEREAGVVATILKNRPDVVSLQEVTPGWYASPMFAHLNDDVFFGEVWNEEAIDFWENKVEGITCPVELNKKEWQTLFRDCNVEKNVYGRVPMMITANCISKTGGKCLRGNCSTTAYLTDRYKKKFPVIVQCNYCMNIILNSVPLSLHNKDCVKWYDSAMKRLSFTIEETGEVEMILKFFSDIHNGKEVQPPFDEYTTGHEKRGAE